MRDLATLPADDGPDLERSSANPRARPQASHVAAAGLQMTSFTEEILVPQGPEEPD